MSDGGAGASGTASAGAVTGGTGTTGTGTPGAGAGGTGTPGTAAAGAGANANRNRILYILSLVALVVAILVVTKWQMGSINSSGENWARQWLALRSPKSLAAEPALAPGLINNPQALSRLREQLLVTRARKQYHAGLVVFFLSRHNTTLTILLAAGLLAAAVLLPITKQGWDKASAFFSVTFVVATALATFAGAFSTTYRQEANAARNALLYTSYDNLENRILSFMAAGRTSGADSSASPMAFIASVDSAMAAANDLAIGFDQSAAPTLDQLFKKVSIPGTAQ